MGMNENISCSIFWNLWKTTSNLNVYQQEHDFIKMKF